MVTEQLVLWCGSGFQCTLSFCLTRFLESSRWWVIRRLLPWEWGCIAATAFGVNWAANFLQQARLGGSGGRGHSPRGSGGELG